MVNTITVSKFTLPLALVACFVISGIAGAMFKDGTIKAAAYSYVQPDAQTFSVWGLLYALQGVFVISQCCVGKVKGLKEARGWLALNYVGLGTWLFVNGAANAGFSFWLAVANLWATVFALAKVYLLLNIDYTNNSVSWFVKLTIYTPISTLLSWITVAGIVNFSDTQFDPNSASNLVVGGADWAIAVCGVATALASYLALFRMDVGFSGILIWALLGIHRNQIKGGGDAPFTPSETLDTMSIGCVVFLSIVSVLGIVLHICGASSSSSSSSSSSYYSELEEQRAVGQENQARNQNSPLLLSSKPAASYAL